MKRLLALLILTQFVRAQPPSVVTRYCSGCHGIDGKSAPPYIPRLSGMGAAYLETRLRAFQKSTAPPVDEILPRKRSSGPGTTDMVGMTHVISDQDLQAAAAWYASQTPAGGKHADSKTVESGTSLFRACQPCHGSDAHGTEDIPRLAGQNARYIRTQLAWFRDGTRQSPAMAEVARHLDSDQVRALSLYLESR